MTPTTITSRVGADGVLSVVVPLGPAEANREVRVTVQPVEPAKEMSAADRDGTGALGTMVFGA